MRPSQSKSGSLSLAVVLPVSLRPAALRRADTDVTLIDRLLGNFGQVLGKILMVHVKDEVVTNAASQHVDSEKLDLIGRMEGVTRSSHCGTPPGDVQPARAN